MAKRDAAILNQTRVDPSAYELWVDSATPFYLTYGRSFSPDWVATVNGRRYVPIPSYGAVNTYYIDQTGINKIAIEYMPQKISYAGGILGIITLLASAAYIARSK